MRIAQLSDIHAAPDVSRLDGLERALNAVRALDADAILISGDIADKPNQPGYLLVEQALSGLRVPVFPIPGNTDDREALRSAFHGILPAAGRLTYEAELAPDLRLLALDVTVDGEAFGDLTDETCAFLNERLSASPMPALVMMHQHPFKSGLPDMDHLICRNAHRLPGILEKARGKVYAVLCGHVHRPIAGSIAGVPAYICPSICEPNPPALAEADDVQNGESSGFLLHEAGPDGFTTHFIFV